MSAFVQGTDRAQVLMLPECIEDYVSAENPVRVIEAFVAQLDLAGLGIKALPESTGRPGYDPRDLLGLYIYGYLHRIRSSRDLERQTHRNLEVLWLMRGLRPDHKTISEFRREHLKSFKGVLRQFNLLCREIDLFGRELVAIDGSLFKAVNSRSRNHTDGNLRKLLKLIDGGIERYLHETEKSDRAEEHAAGGSQEQTKLKEKLQGLRERKARCEELLAQMQAGGVKQVSLSDAESRLMKKSAGAAAIVGYNVQTAVDAKHHLMVVAEATNACNDFGQLSTMAVAAKEELQVEQLEVLADGGYRDAGELERCESAGISPHVPAPPDGQVARGLYGREAFVYDAQADAYRCPGGQRLSRRHDEFRRGLRQQVYCNRAACAACALRARCTRGSFRKMHRGESQEALDNAAARVKLRPEIYAQRKALVEHPFGTLKFWWGQGAFLMRGLPKVNAEVQLSALAYNLRRVLNVLGVTRLLEHLKAKKALFPRANCPSPIKNLPSFRFSITTCAFPGRMPAAA
jgi:transposase